MPPPLATTDELIALNREIAALVRAGVPLEEGLQRAAASAALTARLSQRMQSGATLLEALATEGSAIPRAYRAVVTAGLQSGRLPEALEAVSQLTESLADLRRRIGTALIYPLVVLTLAYALFVGFLWYGLPHLLETHAVMRLPDSGILQWLHSLRRSIGLWSWAVPLMIFAIGLVGWWLSRHGGSGLLSRSTGWSRWLPGTGRVRRNYEQGWFCQLLAALVEHETPLPQALELAADAVDATDLQNSAWQMAHALRSGSAIAETASPERLSPSVAWMLSSGSSGADLAASLRRSGDLLLGRAQRQAEWFRMLTPVLAVVLIGGGAVLLYGLAVFGPLVEMLEQLTLEPYV